MNVLTLIIISCLICSGLNTAQYFICKEVDKPTCIGVGALVSIINCALCIHVLTRVI